MHLYLVWCFYSLSGGYFKRVLYFFQGFSCSSSDGSSSDCESCKIQRSPYQNLDSYRSILV